MANYETALVIAGPFLGAKIETEDFTDGSFGWMRAKYPRNRFRFKVVDGDLAGQFVKVCLTEIAFIKEAKPCPSSATC